MREKTTATLQLFSESFPILPSWTSGRDPEWKSLKEVEKQPP